MGGCGSSFVREPTSWLGLGHFITPHHPLFFLRFSKAWVLSLVSSNFLNLLILAKFQVQKTFGPTFKTESQFHVYTHSTCLNARNCMSIIFFYIKLKIRVYIDMKFNNQLKLIFKL
jgi:hypothetical protein